MSLILAERPSEAKEDFLIAVNELVLSKCLTDEQADSIESPFAQMYRYFNRKVILPQVRELDKLVKAFDAAIDDINLACSDVPIAYINLFKHCFNLVAKFTYAQIDMPFNR